MYVTGTTRTSGQGESIIERARKKRDYQSNKAQLEGKQSHRNKRAVSMIKKQRVNPIVAIDGLPIMEWKNDVLRRLEKVEQQLTKMVDTFAEIQRKFKQ